MLMKTYFFYDTFIIYSLQTYENCKLTNQPKKKNR